MMNHSRLYLVSLLLVLLSACAVRGPVDEHQRDASWQQHLHSLLSLNDWGFDGRASVIDAHTSASMNLRWRQSEDRFDIRLMSFLGQQQAHLQGEADGSVILSQPGKPSVQASSATSLMRQELGWSLPLDGLNFWLRGIPMPDVAADWRLDESGRLVWLEQDGWRIEFAAYMPVEDLQLVRKIRLYHGPVQIRLVMDHWQIGRDMTVGDLRDLRS